MFELKRWILGAGSLLVFGCGNVAAPVEPLLPEDQENPTLIEGRDDIVDVEQTPAKFQSIGNCWLYATATWAESLHLSATGEEANLSESYWTYWNWFDRIVGGQATTSISTGGTFQTASSIIRRYGWMTEADFIPEEAQDEKSLRQKAALAAINASLATGALATNQARADRALVRRELDLAWGLSPAVTTQLDGVFGTEVNRTFRSEFTVQAATLTSVKPPNTFALTYKRSPGAPALTTAGLADALSDWTEVSFPNGFGSGRRRWEQRMQTALHDRQPVILTWFVDFNALNERGEFADVPATPGRQGFHMTVLEDYQVENVPGFGTLPAGTVETRPAALQAALAPEAQITFLRTKNSWGTLKPTPSPSFPGYHDLYTKYLHGPIAQCRTKDGATDTTDCPWQIAPLVSGIVPLGY